MRKTKGKSPLSELRKLKKQARSQLIKIIRLLEKAHRNAGKSKLKFDGPLIPSDPRSVAIHEFLKQHERSMEAARKTIIRACKQVVPERK